MKYSISFIDGNDLHYKRTWVEADTEEETSEENLRCSSSV